MANWKRYHNQKGLSKEDDLKTKVNFVVALYGELQVKSTKTTVIFSLDQQNEFICYIV